MTTTPNMGIYIPFAGQTNYDQSFLEGMINIDQHDHSGAPNKGVPITNTSIADFSITYNKLAPNVADASTGISVNSLKPNQLVILDLLKSIFQLAAGTGFITQDGTNAHSRTFQNSNTLTWSNPAGVAGDPSAVFASGAILGTAHQIKATPAAGVYTLALETDVINPNQTCFTYDASVQNGVMGDTTSYIVVFDTPEFAQQGTGFDGISTFTAPVDGFYSFGVVIMISGLTSVTAASEIELKILVNTITISTLWYMDNFQMGTKIGMNGYKLLHLIAGDKVTIKMKVNRGVAGSVNIDEGNFNGVLVC